MSKEVVIVDGVRTAFGRMGGTLSYYRAEELAAFALKGLIEKLKIDPLMIDDVYNGMAANAQAINLGRWPVLKAGLPYSIPGMGIERQCATSLQSICTAAQAILSDHEEMIVAMGCESHSTGPWMMARYSDKPYSQTPPRFIGPETGPDARTQWVMGITAENLAEQYGVSREQQDEFGLRSQVLALKAIAEGKFKDDIIPVTIPQRKGEPIVFEVDEHPRKTSMEMLGALPPAFKPGGTVTAGNSSGLNDGAVANLVTTAEKAKQMGWKPLGRYITSAAVGVDPSIMGIGPAFAIPKALKRSGLKWEDISLIECNEAFAAQTLAVAKELENQGYPVNMDNLNPNGGAIALGHPNGASGGRLVLTLLRELRRRGQRYGIVSLCIGGGQGLAGVFEALPA